MEVILGQRCLSELLTGDWLGCVILISHLVRRLLGWMSLLLVEICLDWLLIGPIFESITASWLFEISLLCCRSFFMGISDDGRCALLYCLLFRIVSAHIDSKIFNACNCLLPRESVLGVVNLWCQIALVASQRLHFKRFLLVKNGLLPFSTFLRGRLYNLLCLCL